MATERFTLEEFDQALPCDKQEQPLFKYAGVERGEHIWVWVIPTKPFLRIKVRSSIDHTGVAADTGEDSIRIEIQYESGTGNDAKWISVSKGPDAWTTRKKGWQTRLTNKIKEVFNTKIKTVCRDLRPGFAFNYVRKQNANFGRPFQTNGDAFYWMDK